MDFSALGKWLIFFGLCVAAVGILGMACRKIRIAVRKSSRRHSGRKARLLIQFPSDDRHRNQHNTYPDTECRALVFPQVIARLVAFASPCNEVFKLDSGSHELSRQEGP